MTCCTASTQRLVEQKFIKRRSSYQDMLTGRGSCYMTFLVANNTLSNNFKYTHARKSSQQLRKHGHKAFLWKWCFF